MLSSPGPDHIISAFSISLYTAGRPGLSLYPEARAQRMCELWKPELWPGGRSLGGHLQALRSCLRWPMVTQGTGHSTILLHHETIDRRVWQVPEQTGSFGARQRRVCTASHLASHSGPALHILYHTDIPKGYQWLYSLPHVRSL